MSVATSRALYHLLWAADHLSLRRPEQLWFSRARENLLARLTSDGAAPNAFQPAEVRHERALSAQALEQLPADRPLIFRGLMDGTRARRTWTFDFLAETYKDLPQPFFRSIDGSLRMEVLPFRKGLEGVLHGKPPYAYLGGTFDVLSQDPARREDLEIDRIFDPAFLRKKLNVHHKLFLAADKSWAPLHSEFGGTFNLLIKGRKRWLIVRPEDSFLLQPTISRNLILRSGPYARASELEGRHMGIRGWEAEVEEGDVLYLPPFFWHYAENRADSISIESKWGDLPMIFKRPFLSGVVLSATRPTVLHHFKGRRDPSVLPPADVFAR